ncbi:hypothetical protein NQ315_015175, partial [Exocentrus adspersus]
KANDTNGKSLEKLWYCALHLDATIGIPATAKCLKMPTDNKEAKIWIQNLSWYPNRPKADRKYEGM